ncbi:MAG: hypothetical protein HYU37_04875 [Acidobacteria bacterium]|nr:hypothetical protein [Acidobacteriota bacterium]
MLLRKKTEPIGAVSREAEQAEDALFLRLEELARNRPFLLDCAVQNINDEFVTILSDRDSGADVCAWSGPADGIVVEFEAWLERKFPESSRKEANISARE